jgi:hypothetical protein
MFNKLSEMNFIGDMKTCLVHVPGCSYIDSIKKHDEFKFTGFLTIEFNGFDFCESCFTSFFTKNEIQFLRVFGEEISGIQEGIDVITNNDIGILKLLNQELQKILTNYLPNKIKQLEKNIINDTEKKYTLAQLRKAWGAGYFKGAKEFDD